MTATFFLILLAIIVPNTREFEIRGDNNTNGIILYPNGQINIHEKSKNLTYSIDLLILEKVENEYSKINETCGHDTRTMLTLAKKIREIQHMTLTLKSNEKQSFLIGTENVGPISSMKERLNEFLNGNDIDQCKIIRQLTASAVKLYIEIDRLMRRDLSNLNSLISIVRVFEDAQKILRSDIEDGKKFPFEFTSHFYNNFLESSKFYCHSKTIF